MFCFNFIPGWRYCCLFNPRPPPDHVQVLHLDLEPEELQLCRSALVADHGNVLRLDGAAHEDEHASSGTLNFKQHSFLLLAGFVL